MFRPHRHPCAEQDRGALERSGLRTKGLGGHTPAVEELRCQSHQLRAQVRRQPERRGQRSGKWHSCIVLMDRNASANSVKRFFPTFTFAETNASSPTRCPSKETCLCFVHLVPAKPSCIRDWLIPRVRSLVASADDGEVQYLINYDAREGDFVSELGDTAKEAQLRL